MPTAVVVYLIITIVMPANKPDIVQRLPEQSVAQCLIDAKEFLSYGTPKRVEGAVGIAAACFTPKSEETHS